MAEKTPGAKSKPKKPPKPPVTSPLGLSMESIMARCKMDKSHKSQHEVVKTMHGHVGMLKKAYLAGVKYAEESVSVNSEDDQSAHTGANSPEEGLIDSIRRGWPDPQKQAQRLFNNTMERRNSSAGDSQDVKSLARINKHSPEVTV